MVWVREREGGRDNFIIIVLNRKRELKDGVCKKEMFWFTEKVFRRKKHIFGFYFLRKKNISIAPRAEVVKVKVLIGEMLLKITH